MNTDNKKLGLEIYNAKPTQVVDADNNIMQYDVLDEAIKSGQSLQTVFSGMRPGDIAAVNDINYYKTKYGISANKGNPNALDDKQIETLYKQTKVLEQVNNRINKQGYTFGELTHKQNLAELQRGQKGYLHDFWTRPVTMEESFEGFPDLNSGNTSRIGTMQEFASMNPKMMVRTKVNGIETVEYVDTPQSNIEMHEKYGKTHSVHAITDPMTHKPILVADDKNTAVKNDDIYSTEHGPQRLYGSKWTDFWKGVSNGMIQGTENSINQTRALFNDHFRYDNEHIFTQGSDVVYNYANELLEALKVDGNIKAATQLKAAVESGSYAKMKDAFSMSLSVLSSTNFSVANELKAKAQPLDWQKVNQEITEWNNEIEQSAFAYSQSSKASTSAGAFMANLGETMGMMIPQVGIGMLTGGLSSSVSGLAMGANALRLAKGLQYAGRVLGTTVGTSQAISDVYRTGIEMGVDNKLMGEVMIYSLPAVALTEYITGGWMFKSFDDATRETLIKEVIQPGIKEVTKAYAKNAGQEAIEAGSRNIFIKMAKHPAFQKIVDSHGFGAGLLKANLNEGVQENLEDLYYFGLEKIVNSLAPNGTSIGAGQYDAQYTLASVGDTTAGTVFATTILNTILHGVPKMIRHNKGLPDTKSDEYRDKYMRYKVLNNESQDLLNQMHDSYLKGEFDPNGTTVKDITGDEDNSHYVVPESNFLQNVVGLEKGKKIETINEMFFVEMATKLEAYQQLADEMNMNETDKDAIMQLGFSGQMLMNESLSAMKEVVETRQAIDAIAKPELTGDEETDNQNQKQYEESIKPLQETLAKAKIKLEQHTTKEGDTKYSAALNRLMKESVTILNQVKQRVADNNPNLSEDELQSKRLKNDKNFQDKYRETWNEILRENYGYDKYNWFFNDVVDIKKANQEHREALKKRINERQDYNTLLETSNEIEKGFAEFETNKTKEQLTKVLSQFSSFAKSLASDLSFKNSYINNRELDDLSNKYRALYEKASAGISEFETEDLKPYADKELDDIEQEKYDTIKEEYDNYKNTYLNEISAEAYDENNNPVDVFVQAGVDGPQYVKRGNSLEFQDYKNESDEDIAAREQKAIEDSNVEYEGYLDEDYDMRHKDIEEIETWVDSVINKNDNYKKKYKDGRFGDDNAGSNAAAVLSELENVSEFILKAFEIAKYIHDDKKYNEHATSDEKAFTNNLANDDELQQKYKDLFNKITKLKKDVGQAEYLQRAKRDHMGTIMKENVINSLKHIVDLGITDNTGAVLNDKSFEQVRLLKPIPVEILLAQGNYNPEQIKFLAERETVMNNALSFLQNNKELVFNAKNSELIFQPFEKFHNDGKDKDGRVDINHTMFYLNDALSVAGNPDKTLESRTEMALTPFYDKNFNFKLKQKGETYKQVHDRHVMRLKEHLNVLLWIDSEYSINEIVEARKEIVKENNDQETTEQEFVSNSVISFLSNKGVPTYEKLFRYLNRDGKLGNETKIKSFLSNVITIIGDYGVGKTQFVFKRAVELIAKMEGNIDILNNTSIVNITNKLEEVHKDTFSKILPDTTTFINLKRDFIDNINNVDVSDGKVYIIDEASIINRKEFEKIAEKFKGTSAKIIFLGDMFQMRDSNEVAQIPYIIGHTLSTHLLTEQFSSNSQLLRALAETPRSIAIAIGDAQNDEPFVVWNTKVFNKYINGKRMGAKYYLNEVDMVREFVHNLESGSKRALIFANEAHYKTFLSKNKDLADILSANTDKIFYAFRETNGNTDKLIQGLREEEVYVLFNPITTADEWKIKGNAIVNSALYTSIGRASNFVGLIGSDMTLNVTDEKDALSIGQPNTVNNPIINEMKNRFRAKNQLRFNNIDSSEYKGHRSAKTTTTNPTNPTTGGKTTTSGTATTEEVKQTTTVNGKKVDFKVEIVTDNNVVTSISYRYVQGRNNVKKLLSNDGNLYSMPKDYILKEIESLVQSELGNVKPSKSTKEISSVYFTNTEGLSKIISIGDGITININNGAVDGEVEFIKEINDNGSISYEIEFVDGSKHIVSPTTIISHLEVDEELGADLNKIEVTHSYTVYEAGKKNNVSMLFGTSASLINMSNTAGTEMKNKRRNLNDLLFSNINVFKQYGTFKIEHKNTSYTKDNNEVVKEDAMVISYEIEKGREAEFKKAFDKLKGNYKTIESPKGNVFEIGVLTKPSYPVIDKNGEITYESFNGTEEELKKVWANISLTDGNAEAMGKMNLAIYKIWNDKGKTYVINGKNVNKGKRLIKYTKGARTLQELEENTQINLKYGSIQIGKTKKTGEPRLILPVMVGTEELRLIVRMPKFNEDPMSLVRLIDVLKKERKDLMADLSEIDEDEKVNFLQKKFSNTSLFKLIMNNYSLFKDSEQTYRKSILLNLVNIKEGKHIDIVGKTVSEITKNYDAIINNILKMDSSTDLGQIYDFARKEKDTNGKIYYANSKGEPLLNDKTGIYTHAERLNNSSAYFGLESNPVAANNPTVTKPTRGSNNVDIKFEHTHSISHENNVAQWLNDLDNFLGSDFTASEYLEITNNILRDNNGNLVAGYLMNNRQMVLSTATGKTTTARHEAFHFIYGNYVKPEQRERLNRAARVIAKFETGNDITGNEEEWMAYDFGSKTRTPKYQPQSVKDAIGIWNKFKAFMKNLLKYINPLFYAENALIKHYNDIQNGKYRNRLNEVVITNDHTIDYSHDIEVDELSLNDYYDNEFTESMLSEQYVSNRDAIKTAMDIKSALKKELNTTKALVSMELLLGFEVVDLSLLSSDIDISRIKNTVDTINDIIETKNNIYKNGLNRTANVSGRGEMTFKDIEEQGYGKSIISYKDKLDYDMHILSKEENVKSLLQLRFPTYNMANGTWGTIAGPNESYDWSKYKPEHYLSDDKKSFLSSIPFIGASGSISEGKPTFIPFPIVSSILKQIGSFIDENAIRKNAEEYDIDITELNSRTGLFKAAMELAVKKSNIVDGEFTDDKAIIIFSIYNRLFGTMRGMNSLDYSHLNGLDTNVGLTDKYNHIANEMIDLSKSLLNENNELIADDMFRAMNDAATTINNFINGITTVYASTYMKDMLKSTYYNDTIKTNRMFRESYVNDAHKIMNIQKNVVNNGNMQMHNKTLLNRFLKIENSEEFSTITNKETKDKVLRFNGSKWVFASYTSDGSLVYANNPGFNYDNVIRFFESVKTVLGITNINPATIKKIMQAETWDNVTDIMEDINDIGYKKNYMTDIANHYEKPIDFLSDYLGTISYMLDIYKKDDYNIIKTNADGSTSSYKDNLGVYMKDGAEGETLQERIKSVPGYNKVSNFLKRTSPAVFDLLEYNEDIEEGAEKVSENADRTQNEFIFFGPHDMRNATYLLASMISKIEGKVNDSARITAEGTRMYPIINRTAFNDQVMSMTEPVNGILINSVVESVGMSRDMNFVTYGTKNVETPDFIEQALNLFAQGILKNTFYVPVKPASDTGTIRYFDVLPSFVTYENNSLNINYYNMGVNVLEIIDRHNEKVSKARDLFIRTLNGLKSVPGFEAIPLDLNNVDFGSVLTMVNAYALQYNLIPQMIKYFEKSELLSNGKVYKQGTEKAVYHIGYTGIPNERGEMVATGVIPGTLLLDEVNGLEWMQAKRGENYYADKIRKGVEEKDNAKIESAITQMFKDDYIRFSDFVKTNEFKPTKSAYKLSNAVNKGKMKNTDKFYDTDNSKFKANQLWFAYYMTDMLSNYALETKGMDSESFSDYMDLIKRFGSDNTPGISPAIANKINGRYDGGLQPTSNIIVVRDMYDTFEETFKDGNKEYSKDKALEVDNGQIHVNALWQTFFNISFGGTDSVLGNSKAIKPIGNMQRSDGSYMLLKSANLATSSSELKHDGMRKRFIHMLKASDDNFYNKLKAIGRSEEFTSFYDMFRRHYDASTTKDFDQIIKDMHAEIVLWQDIHDKQFYETAVASIVAMIVPTSTVKSPVKQLNSYDPLSEVAGNEFAYDVIDNTKLRAVMNPSQPTDLSKSQAQPSQYDAQMGVGSKSISDKAEEYRNLRSKLQDSVENELKEKISKNYRTKDDTIPPAGERFQDIDFNEIDVYSNNIPEWTYKALEQLESYLREVVATDISINKEDIAMVEMLNDPTMSIHMPIMRSRLIASYRNIVNKSIQGRTFGSRLTQMSGYYSRYYISPEGIRMNKNDILNILNADNGGWKGLSFEEYDAYTDDVIAEAGYQVKALEDMSAGEKKTNTGTIIMPNLLADIYGHRKDESLYEINTVNMGSQRIPLLVNGETNRKVIFDTIKANLNSLIENNDSYGIKNFMTSFLNSPMVRKAVSNLGILENIDKIGQAIDTENPLSANAAEELRNKYENLINNDEVTDEQIENDTLLEQRNQIEETMGKSFDELTHSEKVIGAVLRNIEVILGHENTLAAIIDEAVDLSSNFNKSMRLMLSRVPLTFIGSGGVYDVVDFNNDNGNIVYIPIGMTNRNDADFDIDALTVYMNGLGKNGKIINKGSSGIINQMNDTRIEAYLDKANEQNLLIKSSSGDIKDVPDQRLKDKKQKEKPLVNNSPYAKFIAYDRNKAGADAIGILANALNAISMIMTMKLKGFSATEKGTMLDKILQQNIKSITELVDGDKSIIYRLGSWEQIALDNNKSNTLGKYNIRSYVVNILAALVIDGKTSEEIYDFFNNKHINEIFDKYAIGQRLKESKKNHELYDITKDALVGFDRKIENSSLKYFNELTKDESGNPIITFNFKAGRADIDNQLNTAMDIVDLLINNEIYNPNISDGFIYNITRDTATNRYINEKISNEEGIELFRKEKGFTLADIKSGDAIKKLEGYYDDSTTDVKTLPIYKMFKAIEELQDKFEYNEASKTIGSLPAYIVTAESLFRLSQVMKLRNGLRVLDTDFNMNKIYIENILGMSLKDYSTTTKVNTLREHLDYFEVNNDAYVELKNKAEIDSDNKAKYIQQMAYMLEKEAAVFNTLNVTKFIRRVPQLDNIIKMFDQQDTLTSLMFLSDNVVFKELGSKFMFGQNKPHMLYGNQIAKFNNAIYELVYDKYFNDNKSETYMGNIKYDFSNVFDRQEFAVSFPSFIIGLQSQMGKIEYWENSLSKKDFDKIENDLELLTDNIFLKSLVVSGQSRNKLSTSVNTKEMVDEELSKYQDAFKALPESLKRLFVYYEMIENKLNFKKGSILHIIGTDVYSGGISDNFNAIANNIRTQGLAAFTDYDNTDVLEERFFDYLGMNEELATNIALNKVNGATGPKYIWNRGEQKQNQAGDTYYDNRNYFFKNIDGEYVPLNKNTWKPSISANNDTYSEYIYFVRNTDEIQAYRNNGKATHYGNFTNIERGTVLVTGKDVVVVTSVGKGKFTYTNATAENIDAYSKKLEAFRKRINNNMSLRPGTTEHALLHYDGVQPITITKDLNITINGTEVFKVDETFNSISEMLLEYQRRVMNIMVPLWGELSSSDHASKSYRKLLPQAMNVNDKLMEEKQVAVMAYIYGSQRLVKDMIKQKFAVAESNGLVLHKLLLNSDNKFIEMGHYLESLNIGKSTYSELVREAYNEYIGKPTGDLMEMENEVLANLDVEHISTLFQGEKDKLKDVFNFNVKERNTTPVNTLDLLDNIALMETEMELIDNDLAYNVLGKTRHRLSNVKKLILDNVFADKTFEKFIPGYEFLDTPAKKEAAKAKYQPFYDAYKNNRLLVNREKQSSIYLNIGTSVDSSFRLFFDKLLQNIEDINAKDIEIIHPEGMKYSTTQIEELQNIIYSYYTAWNNWAAAKGFTIEYITKEVPVYADGDVEFINKAIDYRDTDGNKVEVGGVASRLDFVIRLSKNRGGTVTTSDIVLDFKTINTSKKKGIKSDVIGWNIQTYMSAMMYRDNYNVSLYQTDKIPTFGVIPIGTSYDKKGKFIGFGIPDINTDGIESYVSGNVEYWNNYEPGEKITNNYMPMFRSQLSGKPKNMADQILGIRSTELGNNLMNSYNEEEENNEQKNICK